MHPVRTTVRTLKAALSVPRLLIALSLAVALVAIPAVRPNEAGAMRKSERAVSRACADAGGSLYCLYYDFASESFQTFLMTCTLPSGEQFSCAGSVAERTGNMVDC
jgi:hypothetical protein